MKTIIPNNPRKPEPYGSYKNGRESMKQDIIKEIEGWQVYVFSHTPCDECRSENFLCKTCLIDLIKSL